MKRWQKILLTLAVAISFAGPLWGQSQAELENRFSVKGTVTEVSQEERVLRLKSEAGLPLTFKIEEATQMKAGAEPKALADLAADDEVEIQYFYNENYEKIAKEISKQLTPEAPPTSN